MNIRLRGEGFPYRRYRRVVPSLAVKDSNGSRDSNFSIAGNNCSKRRPVWSFKESSQCHYQWRRTKRECHNAIDNTHMTYNVEYTRARVSFIQFLGEFISQYPQ
jgi:hypothetical protein